MADGKTREMLIAARVMYDAAMAHNGRYLLLRRYNNADAEKNALYETATWLVDEGYARWISAASSMGPGIELVDHFWDPSGGPPPP
jgi:hypothetical protein